MGNYIWFHTGNRTEGSYPHGSCHLSPSAEHECLSLAKRKKNFVVPLSNGAYWGQFGCCTTLELTVQLSLTIQKKNSVVSLLPHAKTSTGVIFSNTESLIWPVSRMYSLPVINKVGKGLLGFTVLLSTVHIEAVLRHAASGFCHILVHLV